MTFRYLVICVLSIWGSLLVAKPVAAPLPDDITDLRLAIEQNQYDRVEQLLATAHANLRQGKVTPNYLRDIFQIFDTSNPDVAEFADVWLTHYPDSMYAKTAKAWIYYTIGRNVRGVKFIHETYPVALEIHRNMHFNAHSMALEAYSQDNTLVAASDLLIALSITTNTQGTAIEVIDRVMEIQPNWGTLSRSLIMSNAQYGGSVEIADALCEYFGPMIKQPKADYVRACITQASFIYHGHRRDEIREWMRETKDLWYDQYRVQDIFHRRPASDEEIALAVRYFKNGTTTDLRLARKFDTYYLRQEGSEPIEQIVLARAKTWAREVLEHDPYNLAALKFLLTISHEVTVQGSGAIRFTPTGSPTVDEEKDYLRRRLLASPYHADFWDSMAGTLSLNNIDLTAEQLLAAADMRINAIVYSNHSPDYLLGFIHQKLMELEQLDSWEEATGVKLQPDLNHETDFVCPLVRSSRLLKSILADGAKRKTYSEVPEDTLTKLAEVHSAAETGGHCAWERNAPVEDLVFEPVEVDLAIVN